MALEHDGLRDRYQAARQAVTDAEQYLAAVRANPYDPRLDPRPIRYSGDEVQYAEFLLSQARDRYESLRGQMRDRGWLEDATDADYGVR